MAKRRRFLRPSPLWGGYYTLRTHIDNSIVPPGQGALLSLSGDLLWGDSAVRFVYMDEAGTSAEEPVTVVVGLIIHADRQSMFAEAAIREVLGAVPEQFSKGFVFHATDVWGNPQYRDTWSMADRMALLRAMMSLPKRIGIPISFGVVRRSSDDGVDHAKLGMTKPQWQHNSAFITCIAAADKYIRTHADLTEVGTVVAEDVPEMRKFLKLAPQVLRNAPITLAPEHLIPSKLERELGYSVTERDFRVTRIRNSIHFVEKRDDPLLQLADACAFGLRRFLSDQSFGTEFMQWILDKDLVRSDYDGPASSGTYEHRKN